MDEHEDTIVPQQRSVTERQLRRMVVPAPGRIRPHHANRRHPRTRPRRSVGTAGMSAPRNDVDEADRLARVKLSCTIEPADLRVTGLLSEVGAGKVLGYLRSVGCLSGRQVRVRRPRLR